MRNKNFFSWLSIGGILSLPLLTIGCSTTWMRWKNGENKETKYEFHQKQDKNKYEIRDLQTLRLAYEQEKQMLDLSKLNNHYELIALLGDMTNLKFSNGKTLEQFWKEKDWKNNLWSDKKTGFFDKITKNLTFTIKYKNVMSQKITINLKENLKSIIEGFAEFKNNQEKYGDLETFVKDGSITIDENGVPEQYLSFGQFDILNNNNAIEKLAGIETIAALTSYKSIAAGRLSKLINFPKKSFLQFVDFIKKIDHFLNKFWNNKALNEWGSDKKINWEIDEEGYIVRNNTNDMESLFKAKFIIYILF